MMYVILQKGFRMARSGKMGEEEKSGKKKEYKEHPEDRPQNIKRIEKYAERRKEENRQPQL